MNYKTLKGCCFFILYFGLYVLQSFAVAGLVPLGTGESILYGDVNGNNSKITNISIANCILSNGILYADGRGVTNLPGVVYSEQDPFFTNWLSTNTLSLRITGLENRTNFWNLGITNVIFNESDSNNAYTLDNELYITYKTNYSSGSGGLDQSWSNNIIALEGKTNTYNQAALDGSYSTNWIKTTSNSIVYTSNPALTNDRYPLYHQQDWLSITNTPAPVSSAQFWMRTFSSNLPSGRYNLTTTIPTNSITITNIAVTAGTYIVTFQTDTNAVQALASGSMVVTIRCRRSTSGTATIGFEAYVRDPDGNEAELWESSTSYDLTTADTDVKITIPVTPTNLVTGSALVIRGKVRSESSTPNVILTWGISGYGNVQMPLVGAVIPAITIAGLTDGTNVYRRDGSFNLTGNMDANGKSITNANFAGNGYNVTNILDVINLQTSTNNLNSRVTILEGKTNIWNTVTNMLSTTGGVINGSLTVTNNINVGNNISATNSVNAPLGNFTTMNSYNTIGSVGSFNTLTASNITDTTISSNLTVLNNIYVTNSVITVLGGYTNGFSWTANGTTQIIFTIFSGSIQEQHVFNH